ncbi:MAG TPA: GNAT family N-acetyltransferase [Ensifer sp.]|jgi:GNAT superfamily N-acetyltransferase|uniref:GNAT family N-acetyltransferase n=1 Tax=Ensifer sp. TaxID=1872086 RepID=UPI002E14711F|nr:GNAT family N-acetyltransferase [Ensifer sp.]
MHASPLTIRAFERPDVADVLRLMRGLAVFEGYIDRFRVTAADLIEHGLGDNPRFGVLVAVVGDRVIGIAVHYVIPWTYDLKPTLVLKELFVDETARSSGAGAALIDALKRHAVAIGAPRIEWSVLASNENAKRFYRRQGAVADAIWEPWAMPIDIADDREDALEV